ncbi:MAG: hypothetical protein HYS78_02390 [Parcubacteria group bacterium]|nr:hypothetical protein [Parcubacteria group bacterium]
MPDEQIYKELQEIRKSVKKIQKYLFWNSFWNWVKVGIIILIVALGFVYLPQFLQNLRQMLIDIIPR